MCGLLTSRVCTRYNIDIKADNVLFYGPPQDKIEPILAEETVSIDGFFELEGSSYPILRSQPFVTPKSWDDPPHEAERTQVMLSDLGSGR